jgi:pyrroline-5-carboxylate reductase
MVHVRGKKIGIIGVGNMGQAIMKGLIDSKKVEPENLYFTNRSTGKVEKVKKNYNANYFRTNEELIDHCDVVIIAVKPQDMEEALEPCRNSFGEHHIVISLAAGMDFTSLKKLIPQGHLTRVMMNTPVLIRQGVIGYCSKNDLYELMIEDLFSPLGTVIKLEDGDPFEAFTVASSSGTGFIFELMSYWQDWIEEHGVEPNVARQIIVQTFLGTAALAQGSTENLEELQNKVTSRKGMTAAGLESMRSLEIEGLLRMSFGKAAQRYRELGNGR